jgi:glycosyltransferase involved in cell wall biosynthesis
MAARRRIWLLSTNYPPQVGGVEQVVSHLASHLAANGDDVTVITSRTGAGRWGREEAESGVEVHRVYLGVPGAGWRATLLFPLLAPLTVVYLLLLVRRRPPQLLHLHFVDNAAAYALLLATLLPLPLVASLHGDDVERLPHELPVYRWLLRTTLRRAEVVTGCSAALLQAAGAPGGRVVANGVNSERFARLDGPRGEGYLLALARLAPKKGMDVVLRALAMLPVRYAETTLVIAGEGPQRAELERLAGSLGLNRRVQFRGRVEPEAVPELLAGCRLFVHGSRHEAFGIVLLEAMAACRPVVATRVGGVPEIIADGVHGLLVPRDDAAALAGAITRLLDDPELAARLAAQGQAHVRASFTLARQGERFGQLYDELLAGAG